jgi:hypothetical protein
MYHPPPAAPVVAGALAFTGVALYRSLEVAVALMVLGGVILCLLNLLPRLAWEPIDEPAGPRMRLTVNGHPIRRHR